MVLANGPEGPVFVIERRPDQMGQGRLVNSLVLARIWFAIVGVHLLAMAKSHVTAWQTLTIYAIVYCNN